MLSHFFWAGVTPFYAAYVTFYPPAPEQKVWFVLGAFVLFVLVMVTGWLHIEKEAADRSREREAVATERAREREEERKERRAEMEELRALINAQNAEAAKHSESPLPTPRFEELRKREKEILYGKGPYGAGPYGQVDDGW